MSYLDALGQKVGIAKGVPSEFKESEVGKPSKEKTKAQAMYDKLSPDEKRMVDKMILANRKGSEQSKKVKAQDTRNVKQETAKSNYEFRMRQQKEKQDIADNKAFLKARDAELKAKAKAQKIAKTAQDKQATKDKKLAQTRLELDAKFLNDMSDISNAISSTTKIDKQLAKDFDLDAGFTAEDLPDDQKALYEKAREKLIEDNKKTQQRAIYKAINIYMSKPGADREEMRRIMYEAGLLDRNGNRLY